MWLGSQLGSGSDMGSHRGQGWGVRVRLGSRWCQGWVQGWGQGQDWGQGQAGITLGSGLRSGSGWDHSGVGGRVVAGLRLGLGWLCSGAVLTPPPVAHLPIGVDEGGAQAVPGAPAALRLPHHVAGGAVSGAGPRGPDLRGGRWHKVTPLEIWVGFFGGGMRCPPSALTVTACPAFSVNLGGKRYVRGGSSPFCRFTCQFPRAWSWGGEEKRVISTWLGGAGTPPSNIITSGRRDSKPSPQICGGDPPKYHPPLHPPNITTPLDTPSTPPKTRHSMPSPQSSEAV